jgi:DNA-binding CsgD family transcriptional regulator
MARERQFPVLAARPSGAEVNLSFAVLGDLLRPDLEAFLPKLPMPQRRSLEAALVLSDPTESASDYRTLGLAVLGVFQARAKTGAFVVAIDDLQWLDAASARVLDFALRRLEQEPVALLVNLRADERHRSQQPLDLERLFASPPERVQLRSLTVEALHELIRRRLGVNLSRPALLRLHGATSGNPFYALEIAGALEGVARSSDLQALPLTATLREIVQRRLHRLPSRTKRALLAAAALSRPTVSVLAAWSGAGEDLRRDLERARRAGVVDVDGDRIEFGHPLLAAGIYADATPADRRRIHGELAQVMSDHEERARHLARAATGPDPAVLVALREAATLARARGAPDAALELLQEGIRLSPVEADGVAALAVEAAEIAYTVGDHAEARRLLERVTAGRHPAPTRARARVLLTRVVHDFEAAAHLLHEARAEAADDAGLLSEIERNLAVCVWATVDDVFVGLDHARAALAFAEDAGDDAAYGHALAWLVRMEALAGVPLHQDFAERVERGKTREEPLGVVQGLRYTWANLLDWRDDLESAISTLEALRNEVATLGNFHALGPVLQLLAFVLWRRGDWGTARQLAEEGVAVARAAGDVTGLAPTLGALACVKAHLGEVDSARAAAAEGLALVDATRCRYLELRLRHALAGLELSLGAPEDACEVLAGLASARWAAGYGDPSVVRTVPDEVEALVAVGEVVRAAEALAPFEQRAHMLDRPWALATAERCRGLIAAATGEHDPAWNAFERALDSQRRISEPYELARTLLAYGTARRRAKSRGQARELLEEALAIFEHLGAKLWVERVRGELARVGGSRRPADELTATEQRVAELVAGGRSNKAVAGELFMSVKTVEGNLSRIYRKLGVTSRTQLASRLHKPSD